VRREIAGDDDDFGRELVRLGDRALEQVRQEELLPAVQVGQLDDRERALVGYLLRLVPLQVMRPPFWSASTKPCKDAGSPASGASGTTEDAAGRSVIALQKAGGHRLKGH
jgi:hypothetical protein